MSIMALHPFTDRAGIKLVVSLESNSLQLLWRPYLVLCIVLGGLWWWLSYYVCTQGQQLLFYDFLLGQSLGVLGWVSYLLSAWCLYMFVNSKGIEANVIGFIFLPILIFCAGYQIFHHLACVYEQFIKINHVPVFNSYILWALQPFFIGYFLLQKEESKPTTIVFNSDGSSVASVDAPVKQTPVLEQVFSAMLFSVFGTGVCVLAHWGLCWMRGKPFELQGFMQGRGFWIDLVPYFCSIGILLGVVLERSMKEDSPLKNTVILLKLIAFFMSFYILIINYLYWCKY